MSTLGARAGGITLTSQQRRVLRLVAAGFSTDEIAARLRISARTAQWHISRLMAMFRVPNRASLVYAAAKAGFLLGLLLSSIGPIGRVS